MNAPAAAPLAPVSREMALHAERIDFRSQVNGRDYRLMVSVPGSGKPVPPGGHPVVYLIDGNLHFGIAVDTARIQACWPDVLDPVIVGIGYPTDRVAEALSLRMKDLTTPVSLEYVTTGWVGAMKTPHESLGGMDEYLRVIDEEIKPRVEALVKIDRDEQTLMGHSLGGLTTLHALFRRTASFRHFVSISPSIWWDECAVLKHEAAFCERVRAGGVKARALISVGALEGEVREVPGLPAPPEVFRAMAAGCRMVLNTEELGDRLARLQRPDGGFEVRTVVHADEDHNMVPPAGIARGIWFTMRRPLA